MDIWNYLEYGAWALSIFFAARMLIDLARVDSTYDNELLTSSREGELELTQEKHEL
ncbi:hypothetical protein [Nitratireductor sp. GCM10026969]|uniref:hypothetical protein n=1 Tax=Nitratireductor sp. GCM10026969 TaxID=3252645 RepID=UPI00360FDF6F